MLDGRCPCLTRDHGSGEGNSSVKGLPCPWAGASRLAAALIVTVLVGTACAPTAGPPSGAARPAAPTGEPRAGGRVIVGAISDAKVLSPILATDVPSATVWNRVYASLLNADPKTGQLVPGLAETWDVSSDSKTLRFVLRDGLTWSDGSAFTGEDVAFTVEAVMRSKTSVRKSYFQDIAGAREFSDGTLETITGIVVSGKTITMTLERPSCPSVTQIGLFGIVPKSVFGRYMDPKDASRNVDDAPENTAPPLASGPFKFKEWRPNDSIILERNERFFGGAPLIDQWIYKVYPDANALAAALKTGEVDVATRIEPKDKDDLSRVESLNAFSVLAPEYTYIGWNQLRADKEFFQSKAVRQALAYGLNMDQVIEQVLFGEGRKMVGHTPPVSWAYDPSGLNQFEYDPGKAQQLLEQDGWTRGPDGIYQKGGQRLEFTIVTNSGNKTRETLLQVAVEQYKQIGVNASARTESFEALVDRLNKSRDPTYGDRGGRDYDAFILGWSLTPDPDSYEIWHSSQIQFPGANRTGYRSEVVDRALEDGRTHCGQSDRATAYKTVDKQLNEDQPYNFGFAQNTLTFSNKKVQGVEPGSFPNYYNGYLWNVEKWWVRSQ